MECVSYRAFWTRDCALCAARREVLAMGAVFHAAMHIAGAACSSQELGPKEEESLLFAVNFIDDLVESTLKERNQNKD